MIHTLDSWDAHWTHTSKAWDTVGYNNYQFWDTLYRGHRDQALLWLSVAVVVLVCSECVWRLLGTGGGVGVVCHVWCGGHCPHNKRHMHATRVREKLVKGATSDPRPPPRPQNLQAKAWAGGGGAPFIRHNRRSHAPFSAQRAAAVHTAYGTPHIFSKSVATPPPPPEEGPALLLHNPRGLGAGALQGRATTLGPAPAGLHCDHRRGDKRRAPGTV